MLFKPLPFSTPTPVFYVGPDFEKKDIPCLIYFALSAKESLLTPPYNQIVSSLHSLPLRIFSVDLPFHGENLPAVDAIKHWAEHFEQNENILFSFLNSLEESLRILFSHTPHTRIAVAGLSRGSFIASHIAARISEIDSLLAFAPVTRLNLLKEFVSIQNSPLIDFLDLSHITHSLCQKKIRIYIGNRDIRVSTDACYAWARSLIEEAFLQKIRSPSIELFLKPSIGHLGHGTSPESFEEGSKWIAQRLFHG